MLILALSLSGCFSFLSSEKPTTLEITPDKVFATEDEEVELTAVVKDNKDKEMDVNEEDIKWALADADDSDPVATLNKNTGSKVVLTGKRLGETKLTVTYDTLVVEVDISVALANKAELNETITEAKALLDTPVGTEPGQIPQDALNELAAAITIAESVATDADATQAEVNTAVTNLKKAIADFDDAYFDVVILVENFADLTNIDDFWTSNYKALPGDENKPFYVKTGGEFVLEDGKFKMGGDGGRFTLGTDRPGDDTTKEDTDAGGSLDLTRPYRITIKFGEYGGDLTKKFSVFIDNNTTTGAASMHGNPDCRPYNERLPDLPAEKTLVIDIDPVVGTENSFLQIRLESDAWIILESIKVEYII